MLSFPIRCGLSGGSEGLRYFPPKSLHSELNSDVFPETCGFQNLHLALSLPTAVSSYVLTQLQVTKDLRWVSTHILWFVLCGIPSVNLLPTPPSPVTLVPWILLCHFTRRPLPPSWAHFPWIMTWKYVPTMQAWVTLWFTLGILVFPASQACIGCLPTTEHCCFQKIFF